ncbi:purine-nucleoside phosphorylase, partial [Klebsiella pneumoniae]
MKNKLLVSACLMGFQVRYNGSEKAQLAATLSRWQQAGRLVIHCPELAAGLPTPRLPAEILGGTGGDVLAGRRGSWKA